MAVYKNEIGLVIESTLTLSSGASLEGAVISFEVKKPDKTLVSWIAALFDPVKCIVRYSTVLGDLSLIGIYQVMPMLVWTVNGSVVKRYYGSTYSFTVKDLFTV